MLEDWKKMKEFSLTSSFVLGMSFHDVGEWVPVEMKEAILINRCVREGDFHTPEDKAARR